MPASCKLRTASRTVHFDPAGGKCLVKSLSVNAKYDKYDVDLDTLDENQRKGLVNKFKAFTPPRYIPTYFMVTTEEGAS